MDIIKYIEDLLAASKEESSPGNLPATIRIENFAQAKRVTKPWGYELWLSGATDTPYAFKIIYIKQGTKTSLQLHRQKSEHNCVFVGEINFYYEDSVTKKVEKVRLGPGHVAKVLPNTVHRVEALTDVVLIEASSPELDDVVRLADDYVRSDGRIESEHSGQAQ